VAPYTEKNGAYIFVMPDDIINVSVTYKAAASSATCDGGEDCSAAAFKDVDADAWYHAFVDYAVSEGLMSGVSADQFAPNGTMTRAMVWTVLARMDGQALEGGSPWYAKAQEWSMSKGVSDGTNPDGAITREQLVTMLYSYLGDPAVSEADRAGLDAFGDNAKLNGWAADPMAWAVANGVISGVTEDTLDPQGLATRAQVAAILKRFCEL